MLKRSTLAHLLSRLEGVSLTGGSLTMAFPTLFPARMHFLHVNEEQRTRSKGGFVGLSSLSSRSIAAPLNSSGELCESM